MKKYALLFSIICMTTLQIKSIGTDEYLDELAEEEEARVGRKSFQKDFWGSQRKARRRRQKRGETQVARDRVIALLTTEPTIEKEKRTKDVLPGANNRDAWDRANEKEKRYEDGFFDNREQLRRFRSAKTLRRFWANEKSRERKRERKRKLQNKTYLGF